MTLKIEALRGVWRAQIDHRTHFDDTLEGLLVQLAPAAEWEHVSNAAEVLGVILGAETVNVEPDFEAIARALFSQQDSAEHWEPTDAQQAHFAPQDDE